MSTPDPADARAAVEQVLSAAVADWSVMPPHLGDNPPGLPAGVRAALDHYAALPDWVSVALYLGRVTSPAGELYLIVVGFELSQDGWAEVFGPNGEEWGAAQYVGAKVAWATTAEVRDSLVSGRRVPGLAVGLSWTEDAKGDHFTACGRFKIWRVKGGWKLTRGREHVQTWPTVEDAKAHATALAVPQVAPE